MKKIRVLIAKLGLDGHDRGAKVVARALRDSGMEVVYTGIRQTPLQIVNTTIQEDIDCLGLSILSGAHLQLFPKIIDLLEKSSKKPLMLAGGIIPSEDIPALESMGIKKVFGPGTNTKEIIDLIRNEIG